MPRDSTIIAAGPSNAATDNLLDPLAVNKGKLELGRLGDNQSVFAESRKQFSLTLQASWGGDFGAVKRHVLNGRVRQVISEGKHHALFSTYMKNAELGSCNTYFPLADEAGQATEPTAANLTCDAAPGGHVLMVGGWRRASAASHGKRQERGLGWLQALHSWRGSAEPAGELTT